MTPSQEELGRRLRLAREACQMTQEDVGRRLGLSRPTIAQIELGNRGVTGIELGKFGYLFGRDIREFLAEEFGVEDALVVLFRLDPAISNREEVVDALRRCLALGREFTNLERLLGIDRDFAAIAAYDLPAPETRWEAIKSGERIAEEERRRLRLGIAPLPDVAELLETLGIRTAQVSMPPDISGLTLTEASIGFIVVINKDHPILRRRFSYAHEYFHVVADRNRRGTVSRIQDREELVEVRANSFAAEFLMPEAGVQRFIHALGKGHSSRIHAEVFDEAEAEAITVEARSAPGSQDIQLYDVVQFAHHFGVSRTAALYRLRNLRLLTATQFESLKGREEKGLSSDMTLILDLPEPDHQAERNKFRCRFLGLALEAYRREQITRAKLLELADMAEVPRSELDKILRDIGLDDEEAADVQVPQTEQ